ncbi:Glycosyltransferase, GT2 family [Allochromatium warmingii]|uniref:Glycosyltransferase, GT2 family n=2 Tax=Allochromatium warmingii TaxID=61595 RepID=A0A1H3E5U5_ALLWA|nr:Glycosyltransferase, GT2 family [Allochromatium warmingii]
MLASLQNTLPSTLPYEIILIDDGSTDGTREWLQKLSDPRIKTLFNDTNLGYAAANNRAALSAHGEILGLLNNDLVLTPNWLEPMLNALEHQSGRVGLVGNLQYCVADGTLDHAGVELLLNGQFAHIRDISNQTAEYWPVNWVTGACLLIRTADFKAIDGFDEGYRNGGEDFDLCFALRQRHKTIYLAATSRIQHHVRLSRGDTTTIQEHNSRRLFQKWRTVIKDQLAKRWLRMLHTGKAIQSDLVHGELSSKLKDTPHAAAQLIAENMLRRQEAHWCRELDNRPAMRILLSNCRIEQCPITASTYQLRIVIQQLSSCRNFYVCGIRTGHPATRPTLKLSIDINGLQQQIYWVGSENTFNLGIRYPLILPDINNRFLITFESTEIVVNSVPITSSLHVTHVVIDDEVRALC